MIAHQMMDVAESYLRQIRELGLEPVDMTEREDPSPDEQLQHAGWMCERIKSFLTHMNDIGHPDGYPELIALLKVHTWLGFVQGVLWSQGKRTIRETRDDNRPKESAE